MQQMDSISLWRKAGRDSEIAPTRADRVFLRAVPVSDKVGFRCAQPNLRTQVFFLRGGARCPAYLAIPVWRYKRLVKISIAVILHSSVRCAPYEGVTHPGRRVCRRRRRDQAALHPSPRSSQPQVACFRSVWTPPAGLEADGGTSSAALWGR